MTIDYAMTLLTAGALTAPQLPATASNVCTTDAWPGGVGRVPLAQTKILATPVFGNIDRDRRGVTQNSGKMAAGIREDGLGKWRKSQE